MSARPPVTRRDAHEPGAGGLGRVLTALALTLLISIIVEWIGMTLWWPDESVGHSERLLAAERHHLDREFVETLSRSPAAVVVKSTVATLLRVGESTGDALCRMNSCTGWPASVRPYLASARNIVLVFVARLEVLALATPLFALFALVGIAEGLMRRDQRRWGGGRESSFVYHHGKRLLRRLMLVAWVVYLASPVAIYPGWVFVPFAAVFGAAGAVTIGTFKKHI